MTRFLQVFKAFVKMFMKSMVSNYKIRKENYGKGLIRK